MFEKKKKEFKGFDINRIHRWTPDNVKQFCNYAYLNFDEPVVMINIMIMDRQLQNLNDNYKLVRSIRENEKLFNEML